MSASTTYRVATQNLDAAAVRWQLAIDAAQRAVHLTSAPPIRAEIDHGIRALTEERVVASEGLCRLASLEGIAPAPWLPPFAVSVRMLGLPPSTKACLFDLEGVLTDSAAVHASAWGEVFDDLLLRLAERTGWQFVPFDRVADYRAWVEGKPRLEGVHAFLAARGIQLPEGRQSDGPAADTAQGVAKRKAAAVRRILHRRGVSALPGARRYLEAAGHAGLQRVVVSASSTVLPMLELARLASLVEDRVDADVLHGEHLFSRPAPDLLLAACRRLGVAPQETVTFTHTPTGVAAGRAAELTVIGVAHGTGAELLSGFGAECVVEQLGSLLDRRLLAP